MSLWTLVAITVRFSSILSGFTDTIALLDEQCNRAHACDGSLPLGKPIEEGIATLHQLEALSLSKLDIPLPSLSRWRYAQAGYFFHISERDTQPLPF